MADDGDRASADSYLEPLLWRSEGDDLDFKRDQYGCDRANDDERSELVKDILAMANAWRTDDAFILVGVDERQPPGPGRVVGVSEHLRDSDLQQLLNSRASQPVRFTYEVVPFQGMEVGVVRIPQQTPPVFLTKDFGKLRAKVVYVRRGSATVEADPAEIARMGAHGVMPLAPTLRVEFGDPATLESQGDRLSISSVHVVLPSASEIEQLKKRVRGEWPTFEVPVLQNRQYEEDFAEYLRADAFYQPVLLLVRNPSAGVAEDVRIAFSLPAELLDATEEMPRQPTRDFGGHLNVRPRPWPHLPAIEIERRGDVLSVVFLARKVQPGAMVASPVFALGARRSGEHVIRGQIFSDRAMPTGFELTLTLSAEARDISLRELAKAMRAAETEECTVRQRFGAQLVAV